MKPSMTAVVPMMLFAGFLGRGVAAQNAPAPAGAEPGGALLARVVLPAKGDAKLTVSTPAWRAGGDIPFENTQYKGNVFPGLEWSAGPAGTHSSWSDSGCKQVCWTMASSPSRSRGRPRAG